MAPDQSGGMPRANVRIPSHHLEAAERLASKRHYLKRDEKWNRGKVIRIALAEYLPNQDDLPEDARDILDDDTLANASEGAADE